MDLSGGIYYVLYGVASGLIADYSPLYLCDDAAIFWNGDAYEVADADSDELLYELGLRDGDVLVELNAISLNSYAGLWQALGQLWVVEGELSYELTVIRDEDPVTLYYEFIATF